MTMIVEDGSIVANANSYMSLVEFQAYWTDRNTIITQTAVEQEAALIVSTQYIDQNYDWKGSIVSSVQALDWPRSGATDGEGRAIASNIIPQQLKNALAEYGYRQLTTAISPDSGVGGAVTKQRDKLGSLETETEYEEGTYTTTLSIPLADNWLKGLTSSFGGLGRMSRCS